MKNEPEGISRVDVPENRSLAEITRDILRDIQDIIQGEIRLVRAEFSEKARQLRQASLLFAMAAVCGLLGAVCVAAAGVAALALALPLWLSALIIGILLCVIAAGAAIAGRTRIQQVDPVPRRTVQTLREDLEWAKHRTS